MKRKMMAMAMKLEMKMQPQQQLLLMMMSSMMMMIAVEMIEGASGYCLAVSQVRLCSDSNRKMASSEKEN
jgi:hypothetical protein